MRLLIVTTEVQTQEAFLLPFAENFRSLGWRVDGMARAISGSARCKKSFDGLIDASWSRDPRRIGDNLSSIPQVRRLVPNYDLLHVHTPIASFITRMAVASVSRRSRPGLIYTAHGFHFHPGGRPLSNATYYALERIAGCFTDYLVVINEEDRRAAVSRRLIAPERVRYMNGIGVDTDSPASLHPEIHDWMRDELDIPRDASVVLMVAEFIPRKRHKDLFEAVSLMSTPGPYLVCAGVGPLEDAVAKQAGVLGLDDRVRFLGYRRDIPHLMAASDVLVLPSSQEGLPRSVLEAQVAGLPVVGTDIRGNRDLLSGGRGTLIPVGDPRALAEALNRVFSHPTEAAEQAATAKSLVEDYDIGKILRAHEELYDDALARVESPRRFVWEDVSRLDTKSCSSVSGSRRTRGRSAGGLPRACCKREFRVETRVGESMSDLEVGTRFH